MTSVGQQRSHGDLVMVIWAVNPLNKWTYISKQSPEPPGPAGLRLDGGGASRDCPTPWRPRCASASPWEPRPHLVPTATTQQSRVSGQKRFLNKRNLHCTLPPLSLCQPPEAWQSSPTAAGLQRNRPNTKLWNTEGISSLPCSMAARTLRFSSVAAAKLTAGSRGSTGQSAGFHQIIIILGR